MKCVICEVNYQAFMGLAYDVFECKVYVLNKEALINWLKTNKLETREEQDEYLSELFTKYTGELECISAIPGLEPEPKDVSTEGITDCIEELAEAIEKTLAPGPDDSTPPANGTRDLMNRKEIEVLITECANNIEELLK